MKKFLAVLLVGISAAYAQVPTINSGNSGVTAPTGTTTIHSMGDDGHVHVPLKFGFPFFGKTFTNSVMYDNGVVGFFAPATQTTQAIGCDPAVYGTCGGNYWSSQPFTTTLGPQWNYMIAPLHGDLAPGSTSVYSTTGDTSQMTYRWQNLGEYYNPSNLNTFSLQIKPTGFIGVNYEKVNLSQTNVSVGLTGNLANGEYAQHFWAPAGTPINSTYNTIPSWNVLGTGVDPCATDPLYSTTCSGYAAAYLSRQCTISALYSPSCPGYESAYFTQQCSTNPLYNVNCPGYASAYLSYQCSLDPLYSTTCQGYDQAYHKQQCSINPLYAKDCTGYVEAYFSQQCSLNGLYDQKCPNYAESYAKKMLLEQQGMASTVATAGVIAQSAPTATTSPTTSSSGEVKVALVSDQNVNNVITTTATSAAPSATSTVPLAPPPPPPPPPAPAERKAEPASGGPSGGAPKPQQETGGKEQPKTARQELQAKREAQAKAKAVEEGKNLATNAGKAADMETQKQVQNLVIAAMGYTPGFDAYQKSMIPDVTGYKPFTVYNNQVTVDNRTLSRGLSGASEALHKQLTESQYED